MDEVQEKRLSRMMTRLSEELAEAETKGDTQKIREINQKLNAVANQLKQLIEES